VIPSPDLRHQHADELLEDYLFGTLPAEDSAWVAAHLETCERCSAEVERLMLAVQALPFAAPEPDVAMSDDLWSRIEQSILAPPESALDRDAFVPLPDGANVPDAREDRSRLRALPGRQWLMIAALLVVSLLAGAVLGQALPRFGDDQPEPDRIAIQFTDPSITATGELRYFPDEQVFVLEVTGMPEPPEGYVYQAWLIDESAPIPVGVMNPDSGEFASAGDRDAFQTFAITVEPGPLGNAEPTSDPILVAPLHGDEDS
jgi:hypothetical protein